MNDTPTHPRTKDEHVGLAIGLALGASFGVLFGTVTENLALGISVGIALGLILGMLHDEHSKRAAAAPSVKTIDGATYTLVARKRPSAHQRGHYWLGDNGRELELTDDEAEELL